MSKNEKSDISKLIRTNELDEIKSYSHDRLDPDSNPPTKRPTLSEQTILGNSQNADKESDNKGK